jgi:hypothetical protein
VRRERWGKCKVWRSVTTLFFFKIPQKPSFVDLTKLKFWNMCQILNFVPKVGIGYVVVQIIRHLDSLGFSHNLLMVSFILSSSRSLWVHISFLFFLAKFRQNFDLKKIWFRPIYKKEKKFMEKNGPISPDFKEKKNSKLPNFYNKFQ